MRRFTAIGDCSSRAGSAALLAFLFLGGPVCGQQIRFGFLGQPSQVELTPPHVDAISGTARARLEQAQALAASRNWGEAIDIFRELSADKTERVVALDGNRYVDLRTFCHLQIARFPAEGLAAYRRRVDAAAEQSYRDGIASRDESLLRKLVDEWLCSSWGDDALLALGELALERADYASARRDWRQISPLLRSPDGLPTWLALRGIDLNTKWPEVERLWQSRTLPADWLAYPDTQLDLADIRARLALVSIRAGELDRAELELTALRKLHPSAAGPFGGQKDVYATALARLLSAARQWRPVPATPDWPTFAGSPARAKTAAPLDALLLPVWKEPIALSPPKYVRSVRFMQGGADGRQNTRDQPDSIARESQRPLSCYPIVVGRYVLFADGSGIRAADLATGRAAITADGFLYRPDSAQQPGDEPLLAGFGGVAHGVPRLTLNVADGVLYSRVGNLATSRAQPEQPSAANRIIGLDIERDGLLTFQSPRGEASWSYDGTPVCDGRHVFVAMRRSDVTPRAAVACFDAATGIQQWRTSVGAADTPAGGEGDEITHNLLTLVENRVYFNTNLGLVAAIDADTGAIRWITRYQRRTGKTFASSAAGPLHFDRGPSPCVYQNGLLIVAPSDTPAILALDADTGKPVWQQNQLPDALNLLGVVGNKLIVGGDWIASVDLPSGKTDWIWPESDRAGIRGMGRGVVAGNEIFWPSRNEIYVLDVKTGGQTRPPIKLAPLSGGANLVAVQGRLIVAGYDQLFVLGPPDSRAPEPPERAGAQAAPRTGRLNDQSDLK
jgi:hypothetical protein